MGSTIVPPFRVAVLGAGNGGLALAGTMALYGHHVRLWNRDPTRLLPVQATGGIVLSGELRGVGIPTFCSTNLKEVISGCCVIFVAITADGHGELAHQLAPIVEDGQCILLIPGRTGGALEVRHVFNQLGVAKHTAVAEAQSLVYACRAVGAAVNIFATKNVVYVAAFPGFDTDRVLSLVRPLFPCFTRSKSVLHTSFENIGAIFHPPIAVVNAAAIERGQPFFFYQDMTPALSELLATLDQERIAAAKAYGISVFSTYDWIKQAYPATQGETLCERLQNSRAYNDILAPSQLHSRLILEDVPTGLVPLFHLGRARGVSMRITLALIELSGALLKRDFWQTGRNLEKMGFARIAPQNLADYLYTGACKTDALTK